MIEVRIAVALKDFSNLCYFDTQTQIHAVYDRTIV